MQLRTDAYVFSGALVLDTRRGLDRHFKTTGACNASKNML